MSELPHSQIDLLRGLNPRQAEAVQTLEGPLLILAGAGSGKTKTLTYRIANLLKNGINPAQILAVTFTNKAAKEMKERVIKLVGSQTFFPYLGTFHGICVRILRIEYEAAGLDKNFVIYDTDDQQSLIKRLIKQLDYDPKSLKPKMVLGAISKSKNEGNTPLEYAATAYYPQQKQIAKLYGAYEAAKTASSAVDFDDLLLIVEKLFRENTTVLQRWQDKIKHVLVDEYQDTNHTQYNIVKMLSEKSHNICVVGDDWQSIYSWRGADFTNILNFEADFKGAKVVKLEQNYRSTGNILHFAQRIIDQNTTRMEKTLFTNSPDGSPLEVYRAHDEADEANFVARKIFEYISPLYHTYSEMSIESSASGAKTSQTTPEGDPKSLLNTPTTHFPNFSDIAILYRTNAQSYPFEKAFISAHIPYKIVGGMRFYDRKEIKDVLSILKLIINPIDRVSLERVIKNVISGIGEASLEKIFFILDHLENFTELEPGSVPTNPTTYYSFLNPAVSANLSGKAAKSLASLADFVLKINNSTPPAEIISDVVKHFDFAKLFSSDPLTEEERMKNLEVLIGNASEYQTLTDFLADAALMSSSDDSSSTNNVVTLTTLHASKGLEFPVVFLVGCEEGLFPSTQAELEGNIEEERRLAYVGMTRAMQKLTLSYACSRFSFGGRTYKDPSRFLLEIGYIPSHGSQKLLDKNTEDTNFIEDESVNSSTDDFSEFFDDFPPDDLPIYD